MESVTSDQAAPPVEDAANLYMIMLDGGGFRAFDQWLRGQGAQLERVPAAEPPIYVVRKP